MKASGQYGLAKRCEWILYILVLGLVFEGMLRKLAPPLRLPLFFLKDMLCLFSIYQLSGVFLPGLMGKLRRVWLILFLLVIPVFLNTAFKDPNLALFGLKQYLLFFSVALLVPVAFSDPDDSRIRRFLFFTSLLIIPTTLVAAMQNALPPGHWINLSVDGESLAGFAAAGYLRVSSTFSFTGQYSWFLVAETFLLAGSYFLPPKSNLGLGRNFWLLIHPCLLLMLIVGAFLSGGRTAVVGVGSSLFLGFVFLAARRPEWLFKGALGFVFIIFLLGTIREYKPEYFAAYDRRSSGTGKMSNQDEIFDRVFGSYVNWTGWFLKQDLQTMLLGNGIGGMSNGVEAISEYAKMIRKSGFWTEVDMANTIWEGGMWLGFVWYGLRLFIIFYCFGLWRKIRRTDYAEAAALCLPFIIIQGFTAPLGIQPPLSVWWFLAVGLLFYLAHYDQYLTRMQKRLTKGRNEVFAAV